VSEALLEAIWAAPDDDAPRLVYADALLERGDPRGELIVRQCQGDAASDLVEQYGDLWLGELGTIIAASTYERGFLATARIREPRPDLAITSLIGHPAWRTLRELRGSMGIAVHPSMTALRVLHVDGERAHWRELLTGTPRPITELYYRPMIEEEWDADGDVSATPYSGGIFIRSYAPDEFAALAECTALPSLRRLVLSDAPSNWLQIVIGSKLLDRVPIVESRDGPVRLKIAGGLAVVDASQTATTEAVLQLVHVLPAHLAIELNTGPRFTGRAQVEGLVGRRLRR